MVKLVIKIVKMHREVKKLKYHQTATDSQPESEDVYCRR